MRSLLRLRHFLWLVGITAVGFGAVLAFSAITAERARTDAQRSISTLGALDISVLEQLNQVRLKAGLVALQTSPELTAAATQHTTEMVTDGYFAHNSRNGSVFWKRLLRYYPLVGSETWSVGENMIWTSGGLTAVHALALWMASPEHRANVLNPKWRQVGISSLARSSAPGTFDRRTVIVITTDFGVRG
jgi:uncharacterized protein YkwD